MIKKHPNAAKNRYFLYNTINIIVIFLAIFLFMYNYRHAAYNFIHNTRLLLQFIIIVICAHVIKALRLHIALYGEDIKGSDYIKTYCKTTPVSTIFPLKLGEIYRIYSFGYLINNYFKSAVIILLDRFMDTLALLSIIILAAVFKGTQLSFLIYMLALFLVFLLFIYKIFPNMYRFWKDYYLQEKATKKKLWNLDKLEAANKLYKEVMHIIKGRGVLLYLLSLCAWFVELFNLIIITKGTIGNEITEYLLSALNLSKSTELNNFVIISIILLIATYLVIKAKEIIKKGVLE